MKTFSKEERLCSRNLIDKLIEKGKPFNSFPFRITWMEIDEKNIKSKILISVPKRIYKKAIDRNRLKRLTREGYRKHKNILLERLNDKKVNLLFVYTSKTIIGGAEMDTKMVLALQQLISKINKKINEI